eukprot:4800496-Heterocapsa_arctica.AAC.1
MSAPHRGGWNRRGTLLGGSLEGAGNVLSDLVHVLDGRGGVHHDVRAVRLRPVAPDLARTVLRPLVPLAQAFRALLQLGLGPQLAFLDLLAQHTVVLVGRLCQASHAE